MITQLLTKVSMVLYRKIISTNSARQKEMYTQQKKIKPLLHTIHKIDQWHRLDLCVESRTLLGESRAKSSLPLTWFKYDTKSISNKRKIRG